MQVYAQSRKLRFNIGIAAISGGSVADVGGGGERLAWQRRRSDGRSLKGDKPGRIKREIGEMRRVREALAAEIEIYETKLNSDFKQHMDTK